MKPIGLWAALLVGFAAAAISFAAPASRPHPSPVRHYAAYLLPLNTHITGTRTSGELRITLSGDTLTITLQAQGLPSGLTHMAHLHGFENGLTATCPGASADVNHDGVVDLIETEEAAGVTLVPFNQDPAALDIAGPGYPVASASGRINYHATVSLTKLNQAMASHYHGATLDLDHRVIFLHGVPATAPLPATAASLPGVPAQATLPIACGVVRIVR